MKFLIAIGSCLAVSLANAMSPHAFDPVMGMIFSARKIMNQDEHATANDMTLIALYPSISIESVSGKQSSVNGFIGAGFSNLIQAQIGGGDKGLVRRLRSELYLSSLIHPNTRVFVLPMTMPNRANAAWYDRISLSLSVERYQNIPDSTQYQMGLGWVF